MPAKTNERTGLYVGFDLCIKEVRDFFEAEIAALQVGKSGLPGSGIDNILTHLRGNMIRTLEQKRDAIRTN